MTNTSLLELFSAPTDASLLTYGSYDPALVLLSVLVAIFASWMGLQISGQASVNPGQRRLVLLTGSLALGSGVWAMHFIGMLAFRLCARVDYDPLLTLMSMLPSVLASCVALALLARPRITPAALLSGGVLVGAGIGAMHYTGMAAMRMSLALHYDPAMFALSIVVAVVLATLALWVRFGLRSLSASLTEARLLAISALVMGSAIAGMHYTGMAAARFSGQDGGAAAVPANSTFLALAVSLITVAFTVVVLAANGFLRYRQLYRELSQNHAWLDALVRNIPGITYRSKAAPDNTLVFISEAVERITGYPAADFLGEAPLRTLFELVLPEDRRALGAAVEQALAANQPYLAEYRLLHADGSLRWVWEHGIGVRDDKGWLSWHDGVILDISERRAMEDALRLAKDKAELANAARASFVANMSHEIRTPMNSILGFTDVLLDSELAPEQRRHLDTVRGAGRSLLRLLNEVLDTAKLEKGAMELEIADYNLLALVDELCSTLGPAARAKGLRLDVGYAPGLPACLRGDELRMRQVLTNLLDNAIKFTAAGSVTLSAAERDGQLHLAVRDTGIGIAPERMAAIFEPFTQADASMTRRFGGTGLGTTISKQLVALMGGRIWADSEGAGSCFHVLLPLVAARASVQAPRGRSAAVLPPLRILAADDVPQNLELLALLLARRGHTVYTAGDGVMALELAAHTELDVILMDVQMPLLDGLSATRALHLQAAAAGRPRVPVVAMTASVLDAHRSACAEAGMDGFAAKPVDWPAMSGEIARVLGLDVPAPAPPPLRAARSADFAAGLQRWAGQEAAYRQALAAFVDGYADLPDQLARAAPPQAQALAHRARGLAANLGLERLAEALADSGGAALADELAAAISAIAARTASAGAAAAPAPGQADPAQAALAGQALLAACARGALDDDALERLAQALGGSAAAPMAALRAALDNFDFPLAAELLARLLASLPTATGVPAP